MHCNLFTSQPRGDPSRPPGAVPDPGVVVGLSPHPEQSPTSSTSSKSRPSRSRTPTREKKTPSTPVRQSARIAQQENEKVNIKNKKHLVSGCPCNGYLKQVENILSMWFSGN